MIRVRVDDFPQTKGEAQHTLAAFREFDLCLRELTGGKRYLLGVIPGRCSPDDLLFLQRETDCVIGMHGTDHDESRLDRNGGSQFEPYLTVRNIQQTLFDHRMALRAAVDRPVDVYMPPRNVIDERVFQAGRAAGFEAFTTGPETSAFLRNAWSRWVLHSEPPHEYGRTDEMLQRDSDVHLRGPGDHILTLHWTWETNIGLHHMRRFFERLPRDLFQDFDG
jgi:hypothetical protein